ncbi:MAG: GNAT family N-acetyltransferase [Puniceicoccales bacterium]|jgi:ribosomal protein S18 acetylase RimI-like enzyme|nr:GNAT family N-acetyltransferase [Puniceicoccales bacterium]
MHIIQKATLGDARQLSLLAEKIFRETFGAANTAEDIDLHCRTSYSEIVQGGEISDPNMVTLLGREGGLLVGFAQLRWGHAPDCISAKSPGEIQRLYVASDWHGKGMARDLMNACIREMESRGSDVVWLGVWEENPRAIRFYRKFGFIEVGAHVFRLGGDPQRDIIMAREVTPAPARE